MMMRWTTVCSCAPAAARLRLPVGLGLQRRGDAIQGGLDCGLHDDRARAVGVYFMRWRSALCYEINRTHGSGENARAEWNARVAMG